MKPVAFKVIPSDAFLPTARMRAVLTSSLLIFLFLFLAHSPLQAYPTEVRIGLLRFGLPSSFWLSPADTGLEIIDPLKNQRLFSGKASQIFVKSDNGQLQIIIDGQERLRSDHTVIFSPSGRQIRYLWFGTGNRDRRAYRGSIALVPGQGRMLAINLIPLEDYLRSVVPSEIGDHAPYAALQAQAIAARSYAFRNLGRHGPTGFDLCDGVHCQAYTGLQREFAGGSAAVQETMGMVLMYDGKPANTVYHAHCGGSLSSSQQVWGGVAVPYLISHPDTLQAGSAFCDWETSSRSAKNPAKPVKGRPSRETKPGSSAPGVTRPPAPAEPVHMGTGVVVANASPGESPVLFLRGGGPLDGLPSRSTVRGHRVGMCQDGAIGMGRQGYSMSGILAFYYPGTQLVRFQVQGLPSAEFAQVRLLPPPNPKAVSQLKPTSSQLKPTNSRLNQPGSPPRFTDPGSRAHYSISASASAILGRSSSPLDSRKPGSTAKAAEKTLPDFRKWFWCNLQPSTAPSLAADAHFVLPKKRSADKKRRSGDSSGSPASRKSKKKG